MNNITEANAQEIHTIEFLAGLDAQLIRGQKHLQDRLKTIPGGWRDFRLAVTTTERVIDAVYDTLPKKTLRHMNRLSDYGEIVIRPKPAIKLPDDVQIVGSGDLKQIINAAIEGHCAICVKEYADQKACPLRKALMHIAPTGAVYRDGHCAYLDVVAGNELGKYI